jgi:hypothetical protein
MSTQNTNKDIVNINHRVRSGGLYWKQFSIENGHLLKHLKSTAGAWLLKSEAKLAELQTPKWLISNKNLAFLLNVGAKNLASYGVCDISNNFVVYHDDAPTHFVVDGDTPIRRTRQMLWTLDGVDFIINAAKIRLSDDVKYNIQAWLEAQLQSYVAAPVKMDKWNAPSAVVSNNETTQTQAIKSAAHPGRDVIESVQHITAIVEQLWTERNRRRELEIELSDLREQHANANKKGTIKNCAIVKSKLTVDISKPSEDKNIILARSSTESLSQYLARNKKKHYKSDQLTRMGLLNSGQVYSLFFDSWIDPDTGVLIQKDKFQNVLRHVFHLKHSSHRTPLLKTDAVREHMAVICQVLCKKKPNPTDDLGNKLELDNPAYSFSKEPCVRFQVRYTSKAIDHLKKNWYKLLEAASGQKVTA